jgi:hypothetical protein
MLAEALNRLMVAPVPGRSCKEQEKYRSAVVLTGTSFPFHENIPPPRGCEGHPADRQDARPRVASEKVLPAMAVTTGNAMNIGEIWHVSRSVS